MNNDHELFLSLKGIEKKAAEDSNRDPNLFTQYGQWDQENGKKPDFANSIYTVEHNDTNKKVVADVRDGDQDESCMNHLLVGHGVNISNVLSIIKF